MTTSDYKNLLILGTSHISQQSLQQVHDSIELYDPDIVALEMDRARMEGLLAKKRRKPSFKDIFKLGIKIYIINRIGAYAEEKMGESVGVSPGSEMKLAFVLAKQKGKKIALIDQEVSTTLKKLKLTWKEKFRIIPDLIKASFSKKKKLPFDLRKVPNQHIIDELMENVKTKYPTIYNVLVKERNEYMASKLFNLMNYFPDCQILAIVGAGHVNEILNLVKLKYKKSLQQNNDQI